MNYTAWPWACTFLLAVSSLNLLWKKKSRKLMRFFIKGYHGTQFADRLLCKGIKIILFLGQLRNTEGNQVLKNLEFHWFF